MSLRPPPPKKFPSVARRFIILSYRESVSMLSQITLKIMFPRMPNIIFHGISAGKIKCHLLEI